ncbi:hypothetical protein KP77_01490 [Jeotgalibacillus alimentarius]|uniref:Uncharacterized protein n=1 Tax=Jeotgalibacillus alimentarius TaxID=135826 RepID=A0A0C2SI94_9BACL|nr:hypothetical protein KP77_01490 [Jeotgalibacillus alimentarius]
MFGISTSGSCDLADGKMCAGEGITHYLKEYSTRLNGIP